MDKVNELQEIFLAELYEYEADPPMTDEERTLLLEWVQSGHSVHDNPYMGVYEGGAPIDFIDAHREMEEMDREFEALSDEERGRFIRTWYHEETVDDLRLEIDELSSRLGVYEWVLRKYHLIEIADAEYEEARQRRISFELSIDSDKEVPF